MTLEYDFAVEAVGHSASSTITGTVAAIAADLVAQGGPAGVHAAGGGVRSARRSSTALAARDLVVEERERAG